MEQINITINGKAVTANPGESILSASLAAGIFIPNLCYHPDLEPLSACNLCYVEIAGREGVFQSCSTEVEEGMEITTENERLQKLRRMSMQLILSDHPSDCSTCREYGKCPMQSMIQYQELQIPPYG